MPRHEARFTAHATPDEVWRFVRDFEALCGCIPGVERVKLLDERCAEITVTEKVGVVPLTVELLARIEQEEPPHRLQATARAEHLTMELEVTLSASPQGTLLMGVVAVQGEGPLKPMVDRLFERRAAERAAQFAAALGDRFGTAPPPAARSPANQDSEPRASLPRRWWRGLVRWWRRLTRA